MFYKRDKRDIGSRAVSHVTLVTSSYGDERITSGTTSALSGYRLPK